MLIFCKSLYIAELNAKKVELESEERLKRCEAKLQAQVR